MRIVPAAAAHAGDWMTLRTALWPGDDHAAEIDGLLAARDPEKLALLAFGNASNATPPVALGLSKHRSSDAPIGLAEASLRRDHVNGSDHSPVLFLEGLYVVPAARRRGVARALGDAVAAWGRARGVAEFASDALLDNVAAHAVHAALGFAETERVVYFRRPLDALA